MGSNLHRKNREGIIKAFSSSEFFQQGLLVFAGEPLSEKYKTLINELSIGNKVLDLGRIEFFELNILYSSAECFLFPSYSEGFGWPVIEAQASGCAVICSNQESLSEVGSVGTYAIDPSNIESIKKAIDKVCFDEKLLNSLRAEGQRNLERFSRNNMRDSYKTIFRCFK